MQQEWNYARLTKTAKDIGGPEKLFELLEYHSGNNVIIGKLPFLGIITGSALLSSLITLAIAKHIYESSNKNDVQ